MNTLRTMNKIGYNKHPSDSRTLRRSVGSSEETFKNGQVGGASHFLLFNQHIWSYITIS